MAPVLPLAFRAQTMNLSRNGRISGVHFSGMFLKDSRAWASVSNSYSAPGAFGLFMACQRVVGSFQWFVVRGPVASQLGVEGVAGVAAVLLDDVPEVFGEAEDLGGLAAVGVDVAHGVNRMLGANSGG